MSSEEGDMALFICFCWFLIDKGREILIKLIYGNAR